MNCEIANHRFLPLHIDFIEDFCCCCYCQNGPLFVTHFSAMKIKHTLIKTKYIIFCLCTICYVPHV